MEIDKDKLIKSLIEILNAERSIKKKPPETEAMKRVREMREARQRENLKRISSKLTSSEKPSKTV